jgi:hypothetical protein
MMLRIDLLGTITLRMSGRMTEGCREEVETFLGSHPALPNLFVDLTEVTYIDHAGEETLRWLGQLGANFTADNPYTLHVFERLHLDVAEPRMIPGDSHDARKGAQHD